MFKNNPGFLSEGRLGRSTQNERKEPSREAVLRSARKKGMEDGGGQTNFSVIPRRGEPHGMGGSGSALLAHVGKKGGSFQ